MNKYTITYYESMEAMVPSKEQTEFEACSDSKPRYNWDNVKYADIEATTIGGAYRAFTMSCEPKFVVVGVEDVKVFFPPSVMG